MDYIKGISLPVETPAMTIDYEQVMKNLERVQKLADSKGKKLRPHSKTHKIPYLARKQIQLGAVGVCVQKGTEAEIMFNGGIDDITISNEIVGRTKTDRVARLANEGCRITVAVDGLQGMSDLNDSAIMYGQTIDVLLDIDLGMNRCGVLPEDAGNILEQHSKFSNIRFSGIMAYDGNVADPSAGVREEEVSREASVLMEIIEMYRGIIGEPEVVTVGATSTYNIWAGYDFITELQPGTYVYYDTRTTEYGASTLDELSMGVVATVMSKTHGNHAVLDAGYKSTSIDNGRFPGILMPSGKQAKVISMSEEHAVLDDGDELKVGDRVMMLPSHACTTTDQWDEAVVFNRGNSFEKWKILGRGMRQ